MSIHRAARFLLVLIVAAGAFLQTPSGAIARDVAPVLKKQLESSQSSRSAQSREDVARFYELREYQPAWTGAEKQRVLEALKKAGNEGLNAASYRPPALSKKAGTTKTMAWDVQVTAAFLRYARDVRTGRYEANKLYRDVELPKGSFDAPAELNAALTQNAFPAFIADLPPRWTEYAALRDGLARYRGAVKTLKPVAGIAGRVEDLTAQQQENLWTRLALDDPSLGPAPESIYPYDLEEAVRRFQTRQELDVDGVVGKDTLRALNVSPAARIALIKVNMERWRWMPHAPDKKYVEVNVPSATLKAVKDGQVVLTSAVVIGHREAKTPILATGVRSVVLNPSWPVPASIVSNEVYPKLLANPAYLQERNMILANGPSDDLQGLKMNWRTVRRYPFPYVVEQLPGENNVLGAFLLDMPNRFDTYLHDTPSKELFDQSARFFSHGCVRVDKIAALANFVVTGDPSTEIPQRATLPRDKSQRLMVAPSLPVYFVYWTAFPTADGAIAFRDDVYGRDVTLLNLMNPAPAKPAQTAAAGQPAPAPAASVAKPAPGAGGAR